jgi:hypothetical protein
MAKGRGTHLPVWAGMSLLCGLSGTSAIADPFEGPSFQRGLWRFERMISNGGAGANLPSATFVSNQVVTRCVDPTNAMRETFKPGAIGNCRSTRPEKIDNRYVFALRCDFMGPARTTIEVESDTAYIEINEFVASRPVKTETVIARRVGECSSDGAPAAVALEAPAVQGFGLSSAESKPVRR